MAKNYKPQPQLSKGFLQRVLGLARRTASWESYENLRWFWWNYQRRREAGFVLPTVTMLVLVVALVVAALVARTFFRTEQVMLQRKSQTIYNAATPVLDRARAKLEYLFQRDPRFTGGIPSEATLETFLRYDDYYTIAPNTLPQAERETRLDLNGDGTPDNAWYYETADGERVVYSIILRTPPTDADRNLRDQTQDKIQERARNLEVRTGPLSASLSTVGEGCGGPDAGGINEGWFEPPQSTAFLYKNFQINVVVISGAGNQRSVATLEMVQERQLDKGNKWGAWFLNDLEIHPGDNSPMFWNGAVHTEGSLIVGNNAFRSFLISSEDSCLFTDDASEVSVANNLETGFRGQIMAGILNTNTAAGGTQWHLFGPRDNRANGQFAPFRILSPEADSVINGTLPVDIALRPLELFTERRQVSRGNSATNQAVEDATWDSGDLALRRISRKAEPAPYVDDTYRADNRVGPVPPDADGSPLKNSGAKVGQNIKDLGISQANKDTMLRTFVNEATDPNYQTLGLDGYWERRANAQGLRIIVGERLELGNPFGWHGTTATNPDTLFPPPNSCNNTNAPGTRCHEFRQYRTFYDNLAAVQATAVYHVNHSTGSKEHPSTPATCIATTAHPGTLTTINNSVDFSNNPITPNQPYFNFFTGKGTNGWEFDPKNILDNQAEFKRALNNLAKLAGDYKSPNSAPLYEGGAFPPTQKAGQVYPNPDMTMWGNFSNLRRALEKGNDSIADLSYIDTAACTLGILAYSISQFDSLDTASASLTGILSQLKTSPTTTTTTVTTQAITNGGTITLDKGANQTDGKVTITITTPAPNAKTFPVEIEDTDTANGMTTIESNISEGGLPIALTQIPVEAVFAILPANVKEEAMALYLKAQIAYDRSGGTLADCSLLTDINPDLDILCPRTRKRPEDKTKFPVLWYLFPADDTGTAVAHGEPSSSNDDKIGNRFGNTHITTLNGTTNDVYQAVDITKIALTPRTFGQNTIRTAWQLPTVNNPNANHINRIIDGSGTPRAVSLLDKGMFDAREAMSVRVLDIDLAMLQNGTNISGTDLWLPVTGIVYAFREDSRREDAIARPPITTWENYESAWNSSDPPANRRMNAYTPVDPPVNVANGVSPKPIDYYADPDRRPNGFRLQRGADLSRNPDKQGIPRGLSFISDNPVYIKGNFNLHSTNGTTGNLLEEFSNRLNTTPATLWNNFYARNTAERLAETNFSRLDNDTWRPSEILADAITLLSDRFCDGSIEDAFRYSNQPATSTTGMRDALNPMLTQYGCQAAAIYTSYSAASRPTNTGPEPLAWIRTNPFDPYTPTGLTVPTTVDGFPNNIPGVSPIQFSRHGVPLILDNSTTNISPNNRSPYLTPYLRLTDQDCGPNNIKCIGVASSNYYNAILVQGIVPSRQFQPYGGLHNFPRALEDWRNQNQFISGAFIQLNFSVYTAPFDQDTWEPYQNTVSGVSNKFYAQPQRVWGYDVGLQLVPTSPIAARLTTAGNTRSEFYEEPSLDDPYVLNLRCATVSGGQFDPDASCQ